MKQIIERARYVGRVLRHETFTMCLLAGVASVCALALVFDAPPQFVVFLLVVAIGTAAYEALTRVLE